MSRPHVSSRKRLAIKRSPQWFSEDGQDSERGEVLRRAIEEGFDVLLAGDRNVQYQQNIAKLALGVVVVAARTNRIEDLLFLVSKVQEAPHLFALGSFERCVANQAIQRDVFAGC